MMTNSTKSIRTSSNVIEFRKRSTLSLSCFQRCASCPCYKKMSNNIHARFPHHVTDDINTHLRQLARREVSFATNFLPVFCWIFRQPPNHPQRIVYFGMIPWSLQNSRRTYTTSEKIRIYLGERWSPFE